MPSRGNIFPVITYCCACLVKLGRLWRYQKLEGIEANMLVATRCDLQWRRQGTPYKLHTASRFVRPAVQGLLFTLITDNFDAGSDG